MDNFLSFSKYLEASVDVLKRSEVLEASLESAIQCVIKGFRGKQSLLVCGNGGSAADAQHITAELVGRFHRERKGLKAICLTSNAATLTAWSNDYSYESVFERQVEAYGQAGDILLGISTSGNSKNVIKAFEKAKELGMITIALTGEGGGKLAPFADILMAVPSLSTPMIQQAHLCAYHYLCDKVEEALA